MPKASIEKPIVYEIVGSLSYPFQSKYDWEGIREVAKSNPNKWVRYPGLLPVGTATNININAVRPLRDDKDGVYRAATRNNHRVKRNRAEVYLRFIPAFS